MMMNPDIMSEGPGGEVLLHGGFRVLDEKTLKEAFESASSGQDVLDISKILKVKPTAEDRRIPAKKLVFEEQDLWLSIFLDHERIH